VLYDGEASITFNGEVILSGTLKDGLYHLDPDFVEQLGEDSGSDTPEREAADECAMTSLAFELERIEHSLQVIAKEVKGVHSASLATAKTPGTVVVEDTQVRGSNETAPGYHGYRGGNSVLQYSRVWDQDKGGNETAPGYHGYRGGNSVLREAIPSSTIALMSLGPEDKAAGFSLLDVLHVRLGHMSERNIKYAIRNHLFAGCDVQYDEIKDLRLRFCYTCQMGRMRAFKRPGATHKQYKPLECIWVDYKGPLGTRSVHHHTGFYLLSDHSSGGVWSYPCGSKGEQVLLKILEDFYKTTVDRTSFVPHYLHCDYDTVITGDLIREFVVSRGLDYRVSAPYCHHQNGQIEQAIQTVLDKTRTLLAASQAPTKCWDYALTMAAYLIQRTPNSNNAKTPFEILTGEPPDISNMVHFYAPGVYHLTKEERRGTWDYKAQPCRMLGHDDLSRDCLFTVEVRDYEQAAKHGDFESFISAPTKTSQVSEEQWETSE
jgi:hypothetical protein